VDSSSLAATLLVLQVLALVLATTNHNNNNNSSSSSSSSNVWYVAGLSGHGFKMTSALGEAVVDLVIKRETNLPVDFLRKQRLVGV